MQTKVRQGTTKLTTIHHRQTPMWILDGTVDAGPVWSTEALYQERIHSGIEAVSLPPSQNIRTDYVASFVSGAPHRAAALAFMKFLVSPSARTIYRSFGFDPPASPKESR
jgi:molybdate transport system substrate-binding protein